MIQDVKKLRGILVEASTRLALRNPPNRKLLFAHVVTVYRLLNAAERETGFPNPPWKSR